MQNRNLEKWGSNYESNIKKAGSVAKANMQEEY